jgi:hypothetical protein
MVAERWPFPGAIEIRKEINHYKCIGDGGHQYTEDHLAGLRDQEGGGAKVSS